MSAAGMASLDEAPEKVVRSILRALCERDPETEKRALRYLDVLKQKATAAGTKRTVDDGHADLYVCGRCDQPFLGKDNKQNSCWYHPGYLDVDEEADTWCDWYDNDGEMDTEHNRKSFPDGFKWDCCGTQGDGAAGCTRGPHVPKQSFGKKSKMQLEVERVCGARQS